MDRWLINGSASTALTPDDRGLVYGDGLFETIAVRSGQCRFLDAHLARLKAGCRRLDILAPATAELAADIDELLTDVQHGTLKIIVTRGTGPRGYAYESGCKPTRMLGIARSTAPEPVTGIRIRYCTTRISRSPALAGMKTLNRLEQVLARAEWDAADVQEGLMLNDRGEVLCGTMSNLFVSHHGQLLTPRLDEAGVAGVMRQMIIEVAREADIEVREEILSPQDLGAADGLFLSNALIGIWPVIDLDGRPYAVTDLTREIMARLAARGVEECVR